jgi:hypothetical protein
MDGQAKFGAEIVLRIDRKALPRLTEALADIPEGSAKAWLTDPDSASRSRLYWSADTGDSIGLQPPTGPGRWMTGGFILIGHGGDLKEKAFVIEDGFIVMLSPRSWEKLTKAFASGLPVVIPGKGGNSSLRVEFYPAAEDKTGQGNRLNNIVQYSSEEEMDQRGVDTHALSGYIDDLLKAVSAALARYPQQDASGLLVAVAVKPGPKVKVWCEAVEGAFNEALLKKLEAELQKVRPIAVRNGPIAFALAGAMWRMAAGGSPRFPSAWTDVAEKSGKPMTVDEILKAVWKDYPAPKKPR